jgi:hypothetical protein
MTVAFLLHNLYLGQATYLGNMRNWACLYAMRGGPALNGRATTRGTQVHINWGNLEDVEARNGLGSQRTAGSEVAGNSDGTGCDVTKTGGWKIGLGKSPSWFPAVGLRCGLEGGCGCSGGCIDPAAASHLKGNLWLWLQKCNRPALQVVDIALDEFFKSRLKQTISSFAVECFCSPQTNSLTTGFYNSRFALNTSLIKLFNCCYRT